jgi:hypothetical protein
MMDHRSDLAFKEEAQRELEFLIKDHAFACVKACDSEVRFESKKVFIELDHEVRDREVHMLFGRLNRQEDFDLALFLQSVNPALRKTLGDTMVDLPEKVTTAVKALANALRSEGQGIINGDDEIFERMKNVHEWDFFPT